MSLEDFDSAEPLVDTGTAYGRKAGKHDPYITEVGPGTPCGEFWRRYWIPVALSSDVADKPMQIRILGEDLILFRTKNGAPGLVYPRCIHRGTSLYYGRCEDDGIRCCYHGWKFAPDGVCLDQPCEPEGGLKRDAARQPWYPVQDLYGAVWAYMGPPAKKPLIPRYDIFEDLAENEYIVASDMGYSTGGLGKRFTPSCNWLQHWENVVDPAHVQILHIRFSGVQFTDKVAVKRDPWTFEPLEDGVLQTANGYMADGSRIERNFEARFPGEKRTPDPWMRPGRFFALGFTVPIDDTHYMVISVSKQTRGQESFTQLKMMGKSWDQLTDEERRDAPSDYEAQVSQGPITLHSEERFGTTDRGIVMLRRALRKAIKVVEEGGDPPGVNFDPTKQIRIVEGGNIFSTPALPEEVPAE